MASFEGILLLQRQLKQLKDLCKNPDASGLKSVGLVDETNIFEWSVTFTGPPDTLYGWGFFNAIISFPSNYPNSPPTVKFTTEIWHPNVCADDGRVYGYELASDRWMPVHTVESIVLGIRSILASPNDEYPANFEAAEEWIERRDDFKKKVEHCVWKSQKKFRNFDVFTNIMNQEIGQRIPRNRWNWSPNVSHI